nr:hypothetical protein [Tanacetum cinerariifolium]
MMKPWELIWTFYKKNESKQQFRKQEAKPRWINTIMQGSATQASVQKTSSTGTMKQVVRKIDASSNLSDRDENNKVGENDDYICRGHILNGMSDSPFDIFHNAELDKELWDYLESNVIDKLPPSWKDFKHTLKHGKDDLYLVQLGSHLRIEESLRAQKSDKGKGKEVDGPSVDMTEEGGKNKHHKQNKVEKRTTQMLVVRERGLRTNPKTKVDAITWRIDSGAITHVYKDRSWFRTYEVVEDGSVLYIGDDYFAPVHGKGSVALEFSSGKTITLFNVLAVVRLPNPKRKALGEKGYRFYVIEPNDSVSINSIIESKDAIFDENRFSSIPRPKDILPNLEESQRD